MVQSTAFLTGGGRVGALMRGQDWSDRRSDRPTPGRTRCERSLSSCSSRDSRCSSPGGRELGFLYNDPYAEILGAKHPRALGRRFHDIWSEIWPDISPLIDAAMAGQATLSRGSAARHEPQGLRRADVVHLLLFAGAR